jgi:hypothetical protein
MSIFSRKQSIQDLIKLTNKSGLIIDSNNNVNGVKKLLSENWYQDLESEIQEA